MEGLKKIIKEVKNSEIMEQVRDSVSDVASSLEYTHFNRLTIPDSRIEEHLDKINNEIFQLLGVRENLINKLDKSKHKEEWDEFSIKFYKDIEKRDIASALGHAQRGYANASNDLYRLRRDIKKVIQDLKDESQLIQACYDKQTNDIMKAGFVGQKIRLETILALLELLDLGDKDEKQKTETI